MTHAISLANFALTSTRSWAANSWNARIRLRAENDRLQQELALLRGELILLYGPNQGGKRPSWSLSTTSISMLPQTID